MSSAVVPVSDVSPAGVVPPDAVVTTVGPVVVPNGRMDPLDRMLMITVSLILALLSGLMIVSLTRQRAMYVHAIDVALGVQHTAAENGAPASGGAVAAEAQEARAPDHAAALTYARALDEASIKTSALMLAFVLVFLGALYVLRTTTSAFHLGLQNAASSGTLETSSPGLVMVSLGLALCTIAVLHKTNIDYQAPTVIVPQNAAAETGTTSAPAQPGLGLETGSGGSH